LGGEVTREYGGGCRVVFGEEDMSYACIDMDLVGVVWYKTYLLWEHMIKDFR